MRLVILAALFLLGGCCTYYDYETPFSVDEDTFAEPCEHFCELLLNGPDQLDHCRSVRSAAGPTIVCTFSEPAQCTNHF